MSEEPIVKITGKPQEKLDNLAFITSLMSFSEHGAMSSVFVVEAVRAYAKGVIAAPIVEDNPNAIVPASLWRKIALEVDQRAERNYAQ